MYEPVCDEYDAFFCTKGKSPLVELALPVVSKIIK